MRSIFETFVKSAVVATIPSGIFASLVAVSLAKNNSADSTNSVITWVKQYFGWPVDALKAIFDLSQHGYLFTSTYDFLLGPALPATTAVVVFSYIVPLLIAPIRGRPLVDHLWPSSCHVLNHRLEKVDANADDPYSPSKPLFEREDEFRWLMAFAGPKTSAGAAWTTLEGPEGVGKTHLALTWLRRLRELGWDAGVLEKTVTAFQIEHAAIRRDTAILIDDVLRQDQQELWHRIDAFLRKRRCFNMHIDYFARKPVRLRILLVDQVIFYSPEDTDLDRQTIERVENAYREGQHLRRIPDAALRALKPNLSLDQIKEADGRPLYVLTKPSEFGRRAQIRLDRAESIGKRVLALAALVGPIPQADRRKIPNTDANIRTLMKIFEGESRNSLAKTIPELRPMAFADEVLLRWAADQPEPDWQELFRSALALSPLSVAYRLASLWQRNILSQSGEDLRATMQKIFDEVQSDMVAGLHNETQQVIDRILEQLVADERSSRRTWMFDPRESAPLNSMAWNATSDKAPPILSKKTIARIGWLAQSRPFDPEIRAAEALCVAYMICEHGRSGRFTDLERSGECLSTLASSFPNYIPIRIAETIGLINAIPFYGLAGRFDDLERSGERLVAIAAAFPNNPEIRNQEAVGIHNAIFSYMLAERFDDLEHWGSKLAAVAFARPGDAHIGQIYARSVSLAIFSYGRVGRFDDLERWGQRLANIVARFPKDQNIRLIEAFSTINPIFRYGEAGRFDDLEHWSERLAAIAEVFPTNRAFLVEIAKGASNSIHCYGDARRFNDLERWGKRLAAIVASTPDSSEMQAGEITIQGTLELTEAKGAVNAMWSYGQAGRFDDLERWSKRLAAVAVTFSHNSDVISEAAKGAANAIGHYGAAGRFDDLERWGKRLGAFAASMPDSAAVWTMEANGAASAVSTYGSAQRFGELERWGARLATVADRFQKQTKIRTLEATGAHNALINYRKVDDTVGWTRWINRLASVARDFPENREIQELAEHFGIAYVNQAMRGWPYGGPKISDT